MTFGGFRVELGFGEEDIVLLTAFCGTKALFDMCMVGFGRKSLCARHLDCS